MIRQVNFKEVNGQIKMPSSKSLLHRYLMLSSRSKTMIKSGDLSIDAKMTLKGLKKLGSQIDYHKGTIFMQGYNPVKEASIDLHESGASFRFLLPYAMTEERGVLFEGSQRLSQRPMSDLIRSMQEHGIIFSNDKLPFRAIGQLKGGLFRLRGDVSSQYISGLLMAAPFMKKDLTIELTSPLVSKQYVDMTLAVMKEMEIEVNQSKLGYQIKPQKPSLPKEITVEGDWSNAMTFIAMALIKGEISLTGLFKNSYQGDAKIINFLKKHGANIKWVDNKLIVKKSKLEGMKLDIEKHIDLFPVLSVLALNAKGPSTFTNIKRLAYKESNRIESTLALHQALGSQPKLDENSFTVYPSRLKGGVIDSYNDHRLVMAANLANMLSDQPVTILQSHAIDKSFPNFWKLLDSIGGKNDCLQRTDINHKN